MFRNRELDSGVRVPTVYICGPLLCVCACLCLCLHIFKCLNVHTWWRVYARINPPWLSCSDYSLAGLLGLAPKVAQANTRQVAKPLPQTKYQAKMPVSNVPLFHPQHTCRFPVWLSVCTFLTEFKPLSMLPRYLKCLVLFGKEWST